MDQRARTWLALLTLYIVWGSTYLAIRVMVETVPPLLGTGVRFLVAAALLGGWLAWTSGLSRLRMPAAELGGATLVGALVLGCGIGLVTVAEQEVPSGLAALIVASIPLWVVLLRLALRERVHLLTLGGVVLGLAGVALLVLPGDRPEGAPLWGVLLLIGAAVATAVATVASPRLPTPRDVLAGTTAQMATSGAGLVVIGLASGESVDWAEVSADSALAFAYLVLIGSALAYSAFVWLLDHASASTISTYAFVNPAVALLLGWAILDEQVTALMLAGAAAIVASVAFVVAYEGDEAEAPAGAASRAGRSTRSSPAASASTAPTISR